MGSVSDNVEPAQLGRLAVDHVRGVVQCAVLGEPAVGINCIAAPEVAVRLDVASGAELEFMNTEYLSELDRVLAAASPLRARDALQSVGVAAMVDP
jgi:hypothetical protein